MTFREAIRALANVGYIVYAGVDEAKKKDYVIKGYALEVQIVHDFGSSFPGYDASLTPAAEKLVDDIVNLLAR